MTGRSGRIILFGGSFDPIHQGHLLLATQVLKRYQAKKFYFIPAKQNPLKEQVPGADGAQRLAMVKRSLREADDPRFGALDWELCREGPSYTLLTLEKARAEKLGKPTLLMGNEVFAGFPQWFEPARILALADIIVAVREKTSPVDPKAILRQLGVKDAEAAPRTPHRTWHHGHRHWVDILEIRALPVSSTQVREALHATSSREPPRGIQRTVWQYIKENGLYSVRKREA
jgi:nicotinate-nucleotide adenylyltransferase